MPAELRATLKHCPEWLTGLAANKADQRHAMLSGSNLNSMFWAGEKGNGSIHKPVPTPLAPAAVKPAHMSSPAALSRGGIDKGMMGSESGAMGSCGMGVGSDKLLASGSKGRGNKVPPGRCAWPRCIAARIAAAAKAKLEAALRLIERGSSDILEAVDGTVDMEMPPRAVCPSASALEDCMVAPNEQLPLALPVGCGVGKSRSEGGAGSSSS